MVKSAFRFFVAVMPLAINPTLAAATGLQPAENAPAPEIALKTTDSARVAFRVHRGPYWTVGPAFTRLRHYLDDNGQTGPMFARFLNRPGTVRADALRTEIGFFIAESFQPDDSFEVAVRQPQQVAFLVLKEPSDTRIRDLQRIRDWIRANGYAADGPVSEIYHTRPAEDSARKWETEVQIPVVKRPTVAEAEPIVEAVETTPPTAKESSTEHESARPTDREPIAVYTGRPSRDGDLPTTEVPDGAPVILDSAGVPGLPDVPSAGLPQPAVRPARLLIESGYFADLALVLLPDNDSAIDPIWRGHVGLRVIAIARGVQKLYADEAVWAAQLESALETRLDAYSSRIGVNPRDHAIVTYGAGPGRIVQIEREIMRSLDGLLVRVGSRAMPPHDIKTALAVIVQAVFDLGLEDAAHEPPPPE